MVKQVVIRCFLGTFAKRPAALFAAMVTLAICISSARTAHATCGDYLIDHNGMHHGSTMDDSIHRFLPSGSPLVPVRAPVPCHGPSCGEAPDNGVTDAIPIESSRHSQVGSAFLQGSRLYQPPATEHLEIESETSTCFVSQTLLRPPEAS